ncbi:MAG TPA: EAL domain-containing protein [Spongiibacteraceae bacterium]|nr:EAL domain-containing protein [Spongiibacteraceae bacterium]
MSSAEAVGGIINYLNQREFEKISPDSYHDRPFYTIEQRIHADYASFRLGSLFQPIVQWDEHQRQYTTVAYEALLAAHTANGLTPLGHALTPLSVFALPNDNSEIIALDRLARTLHALNFLVQEPFENNDVALHLNVDPHHLVAVTADHGRVFEQILRQCGLDPTAIVLEVSEHSIRDKVLLRAAIASWQSRGYRIAIDNFGREHQQLQRVLDLQPDFIKIDRSLLYAAEQNQRDRDPLAKIAAKTLAANIQIIATGIETIAQEQLAQQLGYDRLQGFLLGRPAQNCITLEYTEVAQQKFA